MKSIEDTKAVYEAVKKDIISAYKAEERRIGLRRLDDIAAAWRRYEHVIASIAAGGEEYKARAKKALAEYEAEINCIDANAEAALAANREALREALAAAEEELQSAMDALGIGY